MTETKIKCQCGCGKTLYITPFSDRIEDSADLIFIGSELNGRKSFRNFNGVMIDKKVLIKLLKDG